MIKKASLKIAFESFALKYFIDFLYFIFYQSCHASSEELCKSSGATTPLDSIRSSFEPIISNLSKDDPEKSNLSNVHKETIVTRNPSLVGDSSKTEQLENEESCEKLWKYFISNIFSKKTVWSTAKKETGQEPLMAPPEGFGDSPEHHPTKRSFGNLSKG